MKIFRLWWGVGSSVVLFIILLGFSFFSSADTAKTTGFYSTFLRPIFEFKIPVILVLLIISIILTVNEALKVSFKDDINKLKEEVKEYRELTKDKSLDLLINLKDMQKLHKQEKLREFIKNYAKSNPYVLAVQIYRYSFKHSNRCTEYRVNYLDGYVCDDEEVNAITQICYKVNRKIFRQFHDAYMDFYKNADTTKLESFIATQLERLNAKNICNITEEDCIIHSMVIYLIQLLTEEGEEIISTISDSNKEDELNNKKRTGILRGIIHGDFYKFSYSGVDDNKKNRLYVTFCKTVNQVDYIFLITFSPEIYTNNQQEDEFIRKSVDEFQERSKQFDDMI